jgi:hypothetical protein
MKTKTKLPLDPPLGGGLTIRILLEEVQERT